MSLVHYTLYLGMYMYTQLTFSTYSIVEFGASWTNALKVSISVLADHFVITERHTTKSSLDTLVNICVSVGTTII